MSLSVGERLDGSMKTKPVLHPPSGRVWTQLARQTQLAGPATHKARCRYEVHVVAPSGGPRPSPDVESILLITGIADGHY
jgi:hypothetical protein